MSAEKLLTDAAQIMQERAKQYDSPTGERSIGRAVSAFNCVTGNKMTEAEGWLLLQLLKDVRQWTTPNVAHVDSLQDCIAYAALKAECIIVSKGEIEWGDDKELPSSTMAHKANATNNRPFVDIPECKTRETKHDLWVDDKELPSSGIYGDQGYTDQDWRRAECHRFSTDYAAKESQSPIVSNITINGAPVDKVQFDIATEKDVRAIEDLIQQAENADTRNSPVGGALVHDAEAVIGDWIEYDGKGQPVGDDVEVSCRGVKWIDSEYIQATHYEWEAKGDYTITHYRVKE